jgi:hypothetical protein
MANFNLNENGCLVISGTHSRVIPEKTNGLKAKQYYIDAPTYRKIASSAVNLWEKKKHRLTFFTLTFPFDATEEQANSCFSKFIDNLKLNYELSNYIAVKERGEQGQRLHFHAIFDIRYRNIKDFNSAWCATFRHLHCASHNCVRLPLASNGGAIIRSQKRCVKYLCKYLGKQKDRLFYSKPCVFISRDILSKPLNITVDEVEQLKKQYYFTAFTSKYVTFITFFSDKDKKQQIYFNNLQQLT